MSVSTRRVIIALLLTGLTACDGFFGDPPPFTATMINPGIKQGDPCGPCSRFEINKDMTCDLGRFESLISEDTVCEALVFIDTDASEEGDGRESTPLSRWPMEMPSAVRMIVISGTRDLDGPIFIDQQLSVLGGFERTADGFNPMDTRTSRVTTDCSGQRQCFGVRVEAPNVVLDRLELLNQGESDLNVALFALRSKTLTLRKMLVQAGAGKAGAPGAAGANGADGEGGGRGQTDLGGKGAPSSCGGLQAGSGGRGGLSQGGSRAAAPGESVPSNPGGSVGMTGGDGSQGQAGADGTKIAGRPRFSSAGAWQVAQAFEGEPGAPGGPGSGGGGGVAGATGRGGGGGGGGAGGCPGLSGDAGERGGTSVAIVAIGTVLSLIESSVAAADAGSGAVGGAGGIGGAGGDGGPGGQPGGTGSNGARGGAGGAGGDGGAGAPGRGGFSVGVWCGPSGDVSVDELSTITMGRAGLDGDSETTSAAQSTFGCEETQ